MKLVSAILSLIIFLSSSFSAVTATSTVLSEQKEVVESTYVVLSEKVITENGKDTKMQTIRSMPDNTILYAHITNDTMIYYDENNSIVAFVEYSIVDVPDTVTPSTGAGIQGVVPFSFAAADTYDKWLAWKDSKIVSIKITFTGKSVLLSVLKSSIKNALSSGSVSFKAAVIDALASLILEVIQSAKPFYIDVQQSTNKFCSYLYKQRAIYRKTSNTITTYGPTKFYWKMNPIMTECYECRVLSQKYPA